MDILNDCNRLEILAIDYDKYREQSSNNKINFTIVLASRLHELRKLKPNAGIDVLTLMLLADCTKEVEDYYVNWQKAESKYKSLERLINAAEHKINAEKFLGRIQ